MNGTVVGIYIAPQHGEPTVWLERAHVLAGKGIEGDRYFQSPGKKGSTSKTGWEITLVEVESIESMHQDGINISAEKTRRNIITRGISLNSLVGKIFKVGEIELRGIRLCEPCDYLAERTDKKIKQSMVHRGGLRADILSDGYIHLNDLIIAPQQE